MIELNWKTVRFIIVGILGALIYFICSYLFLTYSELPAYLTSFFAYVCSFSFAYLGQKHWAFRSIAPHSVTLFRYVVLQVCCAIFAATFTQVFVLYSNVSPLLISALVAVAISGISYIVSLCWVFADSGSESSKSRKKLWQTPLWILLWLLAIGIYVILYYYMPWGIDLTAQHDDNLFVSRAYSLVAGDWLGKYSQFTLMKGPGYPLFLALTHITGVPLYFLTAIFHSITVSFFTWTLYRLSQSRMLSTVLFVLLLMLPLVISNGRIIRDQIYPDQFLLGFSALIFSLFIADSFVKRSSSAMLSGVMFAWLWLTREEGVWIVPSVVLLVGFAIWRFWRNKCLTQNLISSVLVVILTFSSIQIVFQMINWHVYDRFIGLDIKEKNFQSTLSALQSVRIGELISHVPVSQEALRGIYPVSPSFSELRDYFNSPRRWKDPGCAVYPWACNEIAGGWFIWALRGAASHEGYYQTPAKAANFYARVANEINQACADGRLICKTSLLSYMPEITQQDIVTIPDALELLLDSLFLSNFSANDIRLHPLTKGENSSLQSVAKFLHSQDRFLLTEKGVEIFGRYTVVNENFEKLDVLISNQQGELFPYTMKRLSFMPDANKFYSFSMETLCPKECRLSISIDGQEKYNVMIPGVDQVFKSQQVITLGNLQVIFEAVVSGGGRRKYTAVIGVGERTTYKVRQVLFNVYQSIFPVLLYLGLIAFAMLAVIAIKQRNFSVLFVVNASLWGALMVRLTILLLVHISSFPALNVLYFMPVYSLLLIASVTSLYLLLRSCQTHNFRLKKIE